MAFVYNLAYLFSRGPACRDGGHRCLLRLRLRHLFLRILRLRYSRSHRRYHRLRCLLRLLRLQHRPPCHVRLRLQQETAAAMQGHHLRRRLLRLQQETKTETAETAEKKKTMTKMMAKILFSIAELYWTKQRVRIASNFSTARSGVAIRTIQQSRKISGCTLGWIGKSTMARKHRG